MQQIMRTDDSSNKRDRLEARISPELKKQLQRAAVLHGSTLSEFIISSMEEAANKVIHDHQILKLSTADSDSFVMALLNPPKAPSKLGSAYRKYQSDVSSQ